MSSLRSRGSTPPSSFALASFRPRPFALSTTGRRRKRSPALALSWSARPGALARSRRGRDAKRATSTPLSSRPRFTLATAFSHHVLHRRSVFPCWTAPRRAKARATDLSSTQPGGAVALARGLAGAPRRLLSHGLRSHPRAAGRLALGEERILRKDPPRAAPPSRRNSLRDRSASGASVIAAALLRRAPSPPTHPRTGAKRRPERS